MATTDEATSPLPTTHLESRVAPATTAVLCMEMQRGIVGDLADHPAAAAVRDGGVTDRLAELLGAARQRQVPVVHCTASFRADRAGSFTNMPAINTLLENPQHLLIGSPEVEVVPDLWDDDLESPRQHGISPFTDTSLDTLLRSLGIQTVVVTGVSLNRGIMGTVIEAVNRGYHIVIPTDCVAGYPAEYGEQVLQHSLAALSHLTTSADLRTIWGIPPDAPTWP